ncbi:unnamed protein product [Oreochromis niloticus]|nr:unnamed protein product [Mustela putorius furo]
MDEFRWIQIFLCLMLMIQIAVVSENDTSIFIKVGDDVTLPCLNVIDEQNNCDGTTWVFGSRNKTAAELITLGEIGEKAETKSDRLNVTANCSLVLKNVTVEDVGFYYCIQYKSEEAHVQDAREHEALVVLSVITVTEHEDTDQVVLTCSVSTSDECHHTVKWRIKGQYVDKGNKQTVTAQTDCSTTLSFLESRNIYPSRYNIVCEVTDTDTGKMQQFTFKHQLLAVEETDFSVSSRFIIVSVGLAALSIAAVTVNTWTRTKGNKTQMDKAAVHFNKEEDYVSIK